MIDIIIFLDISALNSICVILDYIHISTHIYTYICHYVSCSLFCENICSSDTLVNTKKAFGLAMAPITTRMVGLL